ncbi:MAG: hypothetical protein KGI87_02140 [Burkholderiales bacterium]|nr:hypothetical protein [Burkholderiales bacterium]
MARMHLLIPCASALSDAAAPVLRDLPLPNLAQLLGRLSLTVDDAGDAYTLSPPHERALASAAGWRGADGCLPFAAQAAAGDGINVGDLAWGLVTPVHWHVGRDHVTLADPAALNLTETESRAAFDAVRALFESEGLRFEWGSATRWYAAHESLAELPCASLDRVIGRNVELWMRPGAAPKPAARLIRRLQSEVQMLLYPHPLNDDREQRGELTLNSFWLSGCGRFQPATGDAVQLADALRAPLLAEDWIGWAQAWRALDAGDVADALQAARAGHPVVLTLCGERRAQRFETAPRSLWRTLARRWSATEPHTLLEAL